MNRHPTPNASVRNGTRQARTRCRQVRLPAESASPVSSSGGKSGAYDTSVANDAQSRIAPVAQIQAIMLMPLLPSCELSARALKAVRRFRR